MPDQNPYQSPSFHDPTPRISAMQAGQAIVNILLGSVALVLSMSLALVAVGAIAALITYLFSISSS